MKKVLDQYGVTRFDAVGISYGGFVGYRLAQLYPSHVSAPRLWAAHTILIHMIQRGFRNQLQGNGFSVVPRRLSSGVVEKLPSGSSFLDPRVSCKAFQGGGLLITFLF